MRENVGFREIKKEILIIGMDGDPFISKKAGKIDRIEIVFRGEYWLEGIMTTIVEVDDL